MCRVNLIMDMDKSFFVSCHLLALMLSLHLHRHPLAWAAMDSCYDDEGVPSLCMPKFENVAFNRTVVASNVCGSPPEDYCMQTGSTRACHYCDASHPHLSHNASFLNDFHRNDEPTWWQSQSMYYGIQYPQSVNLTLHLGKSSSALCFQFDSWVIGTEFPQFVVFVIRQSNLNQVSECSG